MHVHREREVRCRRREVETTNYDEQGTDDWTSELELAAERLPTVDPEGVQRTEKEARDRQPQRQKDEVIKTAFQSERDQKARVFQK